MMSTIKGPLFHFCLPTSIYNCRRSYDGSCPCSPTYEVYRGGVSDTAHGTHEGRKCDDYVQQLLLSYSLIFLIL